MSLQKNLRAVHLYRNSLRTVLSWCVHREIFYTELARIRDEFEKHRGETNPVVIDSLLARGEKTLDEYSHPDPYTVPYKYGGSKYARNPPVPSQIHAVMDYNRDYPPSEQALAEAASAHAPAAAHH